MNIKSLRICIAVFLIVVFLCPNILNLNSFVVINSASADYVDANNNTSCIEEDTLVPGWCKDVRLTNKSEADRAGQGIVTDSKGNIHVVLFDTDEYDIYYSKSGDGGQIWDPQIKIASRAGAPVIATSQQDTIIVVYPMEVEGRASFDIYYSKSLDHGETWNGPIRITSTSDFSTCPDFYISGNTIHLVWNEYVNSTQMDIYYKRSDDLGEHWGEDRRVAKTALGSYYPKIVADSKGTIHVVWQENTGIVSSEVWYGRSIDGNMWETQKLVPSSSSYTEPQIVVGSLNNLHVVWTDYRCSPVNGEIFYKRSTNSGNTWTEDVNVTKHSYDTDSWMPYLATDSSDNIHLVFSGTNRTEDSNDVYYKMISDCGDILGQTIRLTYAINGSRMHPTITVDKDNIAHLVWYDDRDDAPYYDKTEIYYKRTLNPVTEPPIVVSQTLNVSTCKPGNFVTVSGNMKWNNTPVQNANVTVKIIETSAEWTTKTDSNGNYNLTITAPSTLGNYTIRVTVTLGNLTGSKYVRLTVESGGDSNGGVTDTGARPESISIIYFAIAGAVAGGIIVVFALLKMRRPEVPKVEKPKEERKLDLEFPSKIQTMTLRCPGCKVTFSVEVRPKPFKVKCPNCGKEGTIK